MTISNISTRPLGKDGPQVTRVGLGFVGHGAVYGEPGSDEERLAFLDAAFDRGERFWDTADEYHDSEDIIGRWFAANPDKRKDVFLATKFAIQIDRSGAKPKITVNSTPEYCKQAIEKSLKRLGLPFVDLYYVHRLDQVTPIEKTIEAMVELKKAGKIKHIGMTVQVEYNPFCLAIESSATPLLKTARELGIAIVGYCPLGHGFITGAIRTHEDVMKPGDQRAGVPWLREENFAHNIAVVDQITSIADKKGVTTAQLTLAWLLAQGEDVFPIPGTKKLHRLEENLASMNIVITPEEERAVRKVAEGVVGGRVQELLGYTFADTPPLN